MRIVKDGDTAVLVSPGYGGGFVTWNDDISPFEPAIVNAVLEELSLEELERIIKEIYPKAFVGGIGTLKVEWIPAGVAFKYDEYDGYEKIEYLSEQKVFIA